MVPTHEFGLGFRKIERQTISLSEGRDQEDDEGQRLLEDHPAVLSLVPDDVAQIEALGENENRNDTHAHGDFVRNHLGGGTNASQKGVLGVGTVAGQHDAVDAERHDSKGVENTDVQVGNDHLLTAKVGTKRNNRDGQQRRNHRNGRSQPEVDLADVAGREVFLE